MMGHMDVDASEGEAERKASRKGGKRRECMRERETGSRREDQVERGCWKGV